VGVRVFKGFKKEISRVQYIDNEQDLEFYYESDTENLTIETKGCMYGANLVVRVAEVR